MRSRHSGGSIQRVLLVSGRFCISETIIPEAVSTFSSLQHADTLIFSVDWGLGMALDDVVELDCSAGCGHRLYSDRGPLECPCHWRAEKVARVAGALRPA